MESQSEGHALGGTSRAMRLIDALRPPDVPASFARIIVGLFPDWFDFAADKFAVLSWERGLHLIVSGSEYGFAIISTSDSRCMSCIYLGTSMEQARLDMHYQPAVEQTDRAKTVIRLVLRRLFPEHGALPEELQQLVPPGRVFPQTWDGQIAIPKPPGQLTPSSRATDDELRRSAATSLPHEDAMKRYRQVFTARHTVLPVIHVESLEQAHRNTKIARDAGADGVFLINHGMADVELLAIHEAVVDDNPGWWVGVNCLRLTPEQVFSMVSTKVAGVWVDNARIEESQEKQPYADRVLAVRQSHVPDCLYFGGVAFKYQRDVDDLEAACRIAARYMDVVTTSGPGTGYAADVEKIRRMKQALGNTPLAIASGITPENVVEYLPHADCFLVATGVSRTFTELDPVKLRSLVQRIRSFDR